MSVDKSQICLTRSSANVASDERQKQLFCHVLPRGMRYSRSHATSIDLYVSDLIAHSQQSNVVITEHSRDPLPAQQIIELPCYSFARTARRSRFVATKIARLGPDMVIVQQHIPSAARIRDLVSQPVILQRHNYVEPSSRNGIFSRYSYRLKTARLNALAGLTFVSDALLAHFEKYWPDVDVPRTVIHNGFDRNLWHGESVRDNSVLVVGRAVPEKGILEAATAVVAVIKCKPNWRADFILSEETIHPRYFAEIKQTLDPLGSRIRLQLNSPFSEVKRHCERAAIVIVPSKWAEPFGRTCLEAHAGGAAVISSGTGGLRSISGDHALYIDPANPLSIVQALITLIDDSELRQALAKAGSERVARLFDINAIAARFDKFCFHATGIRKASA